MGFFSGTRKAGTGLVKEKKGSLLQLTGSRPGLDYLVHLVKIIRPKKATNIREAETRFEGLLQQLQEDPQALTYLQTVLQAQFATNYFVPALTESGLPLSRGFIQELTTKLKHRILPPFLEEDNFLLVINQVFYRKDDAVWVEGMDRQLWIAFFDLLGRGFRIEDQTILPELNKALHILTQRTVTLGLEREVAGNRLPEPYNAYPFFILDQSVQHYLTVYGKGEEERITKEAILKIGEAVQLCQKLIAKINSARKEKGTSLSQTYIINRVRQQLERILVVTDLLHCDNCFNAERFLPFFIRVIVYEKNKTSIRAFLSENFSFLTYKITEHGGSKGKKYITVTRKEYGSMIRSSMAGGFIVSFTALIKSLLTKVPLAPFWQGFAYSLNYTAGFQLMHETNATLATKQPAYTASSIAGSVEHYRSYERGGMILIAIIIARTARTQLASFFGNLIVVFPLSYALAAGYHLLTGVPLLDKKEALLTLEGQHPFHSLAVLYACFTGVFLFLSGIIAGFVENEMNYGNVGLRLKNHPFFRNTLPPRKLDKVTRYAERNMGALAGNIALGFFLGMSGFFGKIFGIPFDIRHITIASGNSAMAYYTTGNTPGLPFLMTVLTGIGLIGLCNFLVSFALAFTVAVRSRGVRLKDYPELIATVARYFVRFPTDFFFPPRSEMKRML